jgi:hypothetical protein
MLLSPEEFARAWGADALVQLPPLAGKPILNDSREFLVRAGLPALIRYFPGSDGVITFCRLASGLSPVLGEKTVGPPLPSEWSVYWIVGERPCCQHVRPTDINTDWARAPTQVRLPPQTLRRMTPKRIANSARQLVASSPGWRRNVRRQPRQDEAEGQEGQEDPTILGVLAPAARDADQPPQPQTASAM